MAGDREPARVAQTPVVFAELAAMRGWIGAQRAQGAAIGFVPTMGALHAGHVSLVHLLRAQGCSQVVASIFVNPTQFAAHEDLSTYPRPFEADLAALAAAGCAACFAPAPAELYPSGEATRVQVGGPSLGLESAPRPHFFEGVATIVAKLLIGLAPDKAAFGEKDYQQLLVVRRLVADLMIPVEILAGPTFREADGLAMSSRNVYLSAEERQIAPHLHRVLQETAAAIASGGPIDAAIAAAERELLAAGFAGVDYVAVRRASDLSVFTENFADAPARVLGAVRLRSTRLIDNVGAEPMG